MSNDKGKEVTDFGVDADYMARVTAAKPGRIPVGGVPMPPIPRFDQQPQDRFAGVQSASPALAAQRILTPDQQQELSAAGKMIPGVGSAYSANQPSLAKGVPLPTAPQPQAGSETYANPPRPEGSGLRPETVQQLDAVAKANAAKNDAELNKQIEEVNEIEDSFETDEFGKRTRSLLANKERREAIEKRCETMSIEDLITQGEVRQRVPVIPGKFEPTYRSVQGIEDLFVKRLMHGERGGDQYILDKFSVMNITTGLYALNGKVLPTHLGQDGEPDPALFEAKYKIVARLPLPMLADLSVNYVWFGKRLQKLFVVDEIKGF